MEDINRKFIKENGGIINLMVEAGAGAGKTQIMVDTIINMIKRGVDIEEIVLITFTNKATNEMKERLQGQLLKEADKGCEKSRLALEKFHLSNISTIHSFAKKIIDERPFDTIGIEFEVIEDMDFQKRLLSVERLFVKETREEGLLEGQIEELSTYPNIRANFDSYLLNQDMDYMLGDINILFDERDSLIKSAIDLSSDLERLAMEAGEDKIKKKAYRLITKALTLREKVQDIGSLREYLKTLLEVLKPGLKLYNESKEEVFILDKRRGKDFFKMELEATSKALPIFAKLKGQDYQIAVNSTVKFACYYMEKNTSSIPLLSNSELLLYALKTVEKEEARVHLQRKFSHFFVDEFQDTDPVQAKLLFALASGNQGDLTGVDLGELKLMPGRLFVVGDPKQSIYRFRGADLNIYNTAKEKMKEYGKFVPLNRTYRFHKELAEDIYKTFNHEGSYGFSKDSRSKIEISPMETVDREILPTIKNIKLVDIEGDLETMLTDYLTLVKKEIDDPAFIQKLEEEIRSYISGALTKEEKDSGQVFERHSGLISRTAMVKNFLKAGESLAEKYRDYDSKKRRTYILDELSMIGETVLLTVKNLLAGGYGLNYKDILIVSKNKEVLKNISGLLKDSNIPINSSEEKLFKEYVSTEAMISFYEYLERGNEAHLKMFLSLGKNYSVEEIEDLFERDDPIVGNFRSLYDEQQKSYNPLLSAYKLVYEKDFLYGSLGEEDLNVAYTQVERVENLNPTSIKDCLKKFKSLRGEVISPIIEDEDRVRIMNLHKAKGLQGKLVILVGESKRTERPGQYFDRTNGEAYLEFPGLIRGTNPISYMDSNLPKEKIERAKDNSIIEASEENLRLDYVASTRARDALILIDPAGVYKALYENSKNTEILQLRDVEFEGEDSLLYSKEVPKVDYKMGGYLLSYPSDLDYRVNFLELEEGLSGKFFGSFFHSIMELIVEGYKKSKNLDIRSAFNQAVKAYARSNPISQLMGREKPDWHLEALPLAEKISLIEAEHFEFIFRSVEKIFKDFLFEDLEGSDFVGTEVPFTVKLTDSPDQVIYSGIMDLLIKKGDRAKIFDYKTDRRPVGFSNEDFAEYLDRIYEGQLSVYKKATKKILKIEDVETKIIFIR